MKCGATRLAAKFISGVTPLHYTREELAHDFFFKPF